MTEKPADPAQQLPRDPRRSERRRGNRERRRPLWQRLLTAAEGEFSRSRPLAALGIMLVLTVAVRAAIHELRQDALPGWSQYQPASPHPSFAETHAADRFTDPDLPRAAQYAALADYFAQGAKRFVSGDGARILFHGLPGTHGATADGFRGFARTGPLLAALVAAGRDTDGRLIEILRHGVISGTDPTGRAYWGPLNPARPAADDAADIARILWLTRATLWHNLDPQAKIRIAAWLAPLISAQAIPTNDLLAATTVERVMASLGMPADPDASAQRMDIVRANLADSGWFRAQHTPVDLSNAWRESFELFWIIRIDPSFDTKFIRRALQDSADLALHLITPNGLPILGDTICARTALPTPVIAAYIAGAGPITAAQAETANFMVWSYFLRHQGLRDGALTQGYFGPDPRFTENDAGPGTCQWGLRGLLLTLLLPADDGFWTAPRTALPVQMDDFRLALPGLGWVVRGKKATGEVAIEVTANLDTTAPPVPYGRWRGAISLLRHVPARPDNTAVQWQRRYYSSARPFAAE